jgi:hypothetical protein
MRDMGEESVIIADLKAQLVTASERQQLEEKRKCAAEEFLDAITRSMKFQECSNLL